MDSRNREKFQVNIEEAGRLLQALGCNSNTRFRTFDDTKRSGLIPKCLPSTDFNLLSVENEKGAGVFVVVNETTGDKDTHVIKVRALFADLDGAPLEPILEAKIKPHIVVESSKGRFHTYWLIVECPLEKFTPMQKAIAGRFNGDKSIVNLSRVMRLPGFIHQKAEPFQTRIISIDDHAPYTLQQIIDGLQLASLLVEPVKAKREQATGNRPGDNYNRRVSWSEVLTPDGWTLKHCTNDGRELWNKPGHTGQQSATVNYADSDLLFCFSDSAGLPFNEGLSKYAVYTYLQHGGDFSAAAAALASLGYGGPLLNEEKASQVKFERREFDLSRLTLGSAIAAGDYTVLYVVDKLIPENSIILLYAKGGAGKSTIAKQIGGAVETETPFMGRKTFKRPVVIIDFENPLAVIKKQVKLIDGAGEILFWTGSNSPPQLNKPEWEELKELIITLKNPLIIFDTLSSACSRLDILSNKDFAPIMQRIVELRNMGATIVLLHHTPKSDETKYIGASCIYNQCDHILAMYPVKSAGIEKEVVDEDETKVYRLGTKDKTRFEHFSMYVVFDEDKGLFVQAEDPDKNCIEQLSKIIRSLEPVNQSVIINQIGSSISKNKLLRLLKNNEGRLWSIEKGENNSKLYRSIRFSGSLLPA